jgi:hypothetical protein
MKVIKASDRVTKSASADNLFGTVLQNEVVAGAAPSRLPGLSVSLNPGDTALIPPSVKHWHGATPDRLFMHLAFQEVTDDGVGTQ